MEIIHLSFVFLLNVILSGTVGCCSFGGNTKPEVEQGGVSLFASDADKQFKNWMDHRYMEQFMHNCGKSTSSKRESRIYHGSMASPGQFPWMVAIIIQLPKKGTNSSHASYFVKCSGQIIAPSYVLTAAHCLSGHRKIFVLTGHFDARRHLNSTRLFLSEKSIIHEEFQDIRKGTSSLAINDIGLLKMPKPFDFRDPDIGMACLPVYPTGSNPFELNSKNELTIMGYGVKESGKKSCCLQYANEIQSLGWKECQAEMKSIPSLNPDMSVLLEKGINKDTLCTIGIGGRFATTCMGDSGGGLYYLSTKSKKKQFLLGLTSYGWDNHGICDAKRPVVYTDVRSKLPWIASKMS